MAAPANRPTSFRIKAPPSCVGSWEYCSLAGRWPRFPAGVGLMPARGQGRMRTRAYTAAVSCARAKIAYRSPSVKSVPPRRADWVPARQLASRSRGVASVAGTSFQGRRRPSGYSGLMLPGAAIGGVSGVAAIRNSAARHAGVTTDACGHGAGQAVEARPEPGSTTSAAMAAPVSRLPSWSRNAHGLRRRTRQGRDAGGSDRGDGGGPQLATCAAQGGDGQGELRQVTLARQAARQVLEGGRRRRAALTTVDEGLQRPAVPPAGHGTPRS